MREDIAARYRDMTANPQQIIYSTIPPEDRTDYLPPRGDKSTIPRAYDAADFLLSDAPAHADTNLRRRNRHRSQEGQRSPWPPVIVRTSRRNKTPGGKTAAEKTDSAEPENGNSPPASQAESAANEEDLLTIAMQEQREVRKRRGDKIAERLRKQMLVPCTCGAWIRVHDDKAGKVVRCRQCKQLVNVPNIRRKVEKKEDTPAVAKLAVTWIEGIRFFRLAPTSIVLKPGSIADKFIDADLAVTESHMVVIAFTGGRQEEARTDGEGT